MAVRLVAVDIDGTLLDGRGQLPAANARAIVAAVAHGVKVVLVTGRSFHFARPVAESLACETALIVSNGALVKARDGTTLARRLLPRDVARDVLIGVGRSCDAAALIFDRPNGWQVVTDRMDWTHPNRRGYYERCREHIGRVETLPDALTQDPVQVMFNGPVGEMRELLSLLRSLPCAGRVHVSLTEYAERDFTLVDVLAAGCTKGAALAEWSRDQGIARTEVMAIGDNLNDLEMLDYAGVPVVMGNAVEALKTRGWHVTTRHDEAGVAAAIARFVLSDQPTGGLTKPSRTASEPGLP